MLKALLNRCHIGDCLQVMREFPDGFVNTCVTSPPYFGLRDYGHEGQIGLEPTPDEYVAKLVEVFREVRRVLRDDGTLWLNLGDSYAGSRGGGAPSFSSTLTGNGHNGGGPKIRAMTNSRRRDDHSIPRSDVRIAGLKPKDLIGIPWRVAFALRQPYERATIKDKIDRAWLAALVDGEGCMTIFEADNGKGTATSYPPILQVKMCDPECIQHANAITGFEQNLHQASPSTRGNRDTYQWRITGRRAADVAAEIYPYLRIKRKQAVILWNHQMVRDGYETKRGVPMPADAREKQQQCRELIQKLNQKQPVDIPDWMVEPRINVEPGWYLRQDVIWAKPNPMPESVRDRCTKSHEYLFLLSKSERYYFDSEAMKEPVQSNKGNGKSFRGGGSYTGGNAFNNHQLKDRETHGNAPNEDGTRNRRSVWTVATRPYKGAHFATYPPELVEPCVLAGSPEGGVVLDPFFGSGTTGQVAEKLGRAWVGVEVNPSYVPLQRERLQQMGLIPAEEEAA